MKKTLGIGLLFGLLSLSVTAQNTFVSGTINQGNEETVSLIYYHQTLTYDQEKLESPIAPDRTFSFKFQLDEPKEVYLVGEEFTHRLFLYPGDQLQFNPPGVAKEDADPKNEIRGEGPGIAASIFLANYREKFESDELRQKTRSLMTGKRADSLKLWIEESLAERLRFLKQEAETEELVPSFVTRMENQFQYDQYAMLLNFPSYYAYYQKVELSEVPLPEDYFDFLDKVAIINEEALATSSYGQFLKMYFSHVMRESRPEEDVPFNEKMEMLPEILDGKPMQYVQASMIFDELKYGDPLIGMDAYGQFSGNEENALYAGYLRPAYEVAKRLAPGQPAPEFSLVNLEGEKVSLEDYHGKVVYLDFWASWCGPCIAEMPHGKKLKERFAGKDVVFLYVSIDDKEEDWRKGVEQLSLTGELLFSPGFESDAPRNYGVKGIPNYFLINRDGTIALSNPDRPSGEKVDEQISTALSRKVENSQDK